jgi:hypothetical protein
LLGEHSSVASTPTSGRQTDVQAPVRVHRIVWDTRRDRPAGDYLQRLAGCGDVAEWFPVERRLEIKTTDMDVFLVSDEQLAALAVSHLPTAG